MEKTTLKNGLRIIYQKNNSDLITINIAVEVGSINENESNKGISHFLEHMVFEGTKNRTAEQITLEIEKYGGELNAYTSNEKTNYYIKIHKRHAKIAIEILADMLINSSFDEKAIKKEKNVVLEEINMDLDEPRSYQWSLFQKSLFQESYGYEIYGSKKSVKNLTKETISDFHKKHYIPENIIITIVGNCKDYEKIIKNYFIFEKNPKDNAQISQKKKFNTNLKFPICKYNTQKQIIKEKKKNLSLNYLIIGYPGFERTKRESYILDIIQSILSKGQSGKLFVEIRTKRGLTYNLGICHNSAPQYGFFAFYSSAEKSKIETIEKIFFNELKKVQNISIEDIEDAKSYIEGQIALRNEDSQDYADSISLFEECNELNNFKTYIKTIKSITKDEIVKMAKYIYGSNYTKILLH